MAITSAICSSWKGELGVGTHNYTVSTGDAFKAALIKASPTRSYGAATANYSELIASTTDELPTAGNYTTGGVALTNVTPVVSGTTALFDFADFTISSATFSTDGMMIYNSSKSNRSATLHDFGGTKSPSAGAFTVTFPAATVGNAYIQLA